MEYKNYYEILGVGKQANEKEIKRAYRRLAREFHPDKNPNNKSAEERFKEVNEAYEVLGNSENRAKYDQLGQNYHRYRQMGGAPGGFDFSQWTAAGGPGGGYQRVNIDADGLFGAGGGFSEFFNTIFGGSWQTQGRQASGGYGRGMKGQDLEHRVNISLEEAFHGTSRRLTINGNQQFTSKIPRGAKTGTKIRLRGKGSPGPGGPGDLYLVVHVEPHRTFRRDKDDLRVNLPVDVVTAVLGGKVTVPTMTGPVQLTIPPGTQGGRVFRLSGKGMPKLREADQYGDLRVTVRIRVPESIGDDERALYEQLAELTAGTKEPDSAAD